MLGCDCYTVELRYVSVLLPSVVDGIFGASCMCVYVLCVYVVICTARSPVFCAMFEHEMEERIQVGSSSSLSVSSLQLLISK